MRDPLESMIDRELRQAVQPEATLMADHLRARFGDAVRAILFYGSCLRHGESRGVLDFYILVEDYHAIHGAWLPAMLNRLLPPNVYFEQTQTMPPIAAKVAIISVRQFERRMRGQSLDTTLWARFAQPSALLYVSHDRIREAVIAALGQAQRTALGWARQFAPDTDEARTLWVALFRKTYAAELRVEAADRAEQIYDAHPERYDAVVSALPRGGHPHRAWPLRRATGKSLSVLRLIKGAFTFSGAADYVAFKIQRHTGMHLELTPWQRQHPLLAAPRLLARLYKGGALK